MKNYIVFNAECTDSGEWVTLRGSEVDIPNNVGLKPIMCISKDKSEYKYRLYDKESGIPLCLSFRKEATEATIKDVARKIKANLTTPEVAAKTIANYAETMRGYKERPLC